MPEPARITVTLRVMGDSLDPDEVTRLFGVEPTFSARVGDVRHTPSGREISTRTNSWMLKADDAAPGDLGDRIATLLNQLPSDPAVWRGLCRRFCCDVFCGLFVEGGNAGAGLRPEIMAMLGERGLPLNLDIYACAD